MKLLGGILSKSSSSSTASSTTNSASNPSSSSSSSNNLTLSSNSFTSSGTLNQSVSSLGTNSSISTTAIQRSRKEQLLLASGEFCNHSSSSSSSVPTSVFSSTTLSSSGSYNLSSSTETSQSSSKKKASKKAKQQQKSLQQHTPQPQIQANTTTAALNLSSSQNNNNFSSPIPTQSSSFTPKKQTNNKDCYQQQQSLTSPLVSTSISTSNTNRDLAQQNSEDFLNSLSFAFPQIEYEEVMKKIQQQQQQQQQMQRNVTTKTESAEDNNITAENIDATSDGYDFEYVNREEEEKCNKKNAKSSSKCSSSKSNTAAITKHAVPSKSSAVNEKNLKTPLKQKVADHSNSQSSKSKNKQSSSDTVEAPSSSEPPGSVTPSKSRISLKPSTSSRQLAKKNKSLLRNSVSKSLSNFGPKTSNNASDQVISVVMDSSPTYTQDDDSDDDNGPTSNQTTKQDANITAMNCHHDDDSDEEMENSEDISTPTTPNKKRKANASFSDSPASSKKKKDSLMMDSVIKKVMEFSIPNTPQLEEESPAQSTALTISPSLSYNSDSTCGEQVGLDICSTSPLDTLTYEGNLFSTVSGASSCKGIDIKEVNQRISSLITVIEKRNEQIAQRDALILQLSKENKDLKKFKNMIEKLEDVGVVFYMKASELCCNGLMARDDKSKDSMEVVASSVQQGMRYMRASAEFGNVDAMFEYAELLLRYSKNRKNEAKEYLKRASELGHKKAGVFLKSLENKEEKVRYEKSVEHDHLFLYGNDPKNNHSKKRR
ncbi:hypothetical protein C9374_004104 [Naegleria lovaniensis]|uniref:Uncharacterized protein n=1 Tax=Naegleria lovaniensis TaxID=51637 RepID=A0AA88KKU0_NAELO|nr:uncharacterized protein C9374_004104 [Naegleria lovaniensis]KAG2383433.1 hypothetical protein C9374_004104 [Naegleria lovaniensis]